MKTVNVTSNEGGFIFHPDSKIRWLPGETHEVSKEIADQLVAEGCNITVTPGKPDVEKVVKGNGN